MSRGGRKNYYAVARGWQPGIYTDWPAAERQVRGFQGNRYKGFVSLEEAQVFMVAEAHGGGGWEAPQAAAPTYHDSESEPGCLPSAARAPGDPSNAELVSGHLPPTNSAPPEAAAFAQYAWDRQGGLAPAIAAASQRRRQQAAPAAALHAGQQHAVRAAHSGRAAGPNVRVEFDGASKNNPGPAGFGAVLYDGDTGEELHRVIGYMGTATNNQAEYAGLIAGLEAADSLGARRVTAQGDSMLVVQQVLGRWKVKNEGLRPYHNVARRMAEGFEEFAARQVPRAQNVVADGLSNQAIQEHFAGVRPQVWRLGAKHSQHDEQETASRPAKRRRAAGGA